MAASFLPWPVTDMDCKTALELLVCVPEGSCEDDPDVREALAHLERCSACEHRERQVRADDARLREALVRVEVPEGLLERLLTTVTGEVSVPEVAVVSLPPASLTRRQLWTRTIIGSVLAMGLLIAVMWWNVPGPVSGAMPLAAARVSLDELFANDASRWSSLKPWVEEDSQVRLNSPDPEVRLLERMDPREVDLNGQPGPEGVAYQFKLGRVQGVIVILPATLVIPPENELPTPSSQRIFVWKSADGSQSYICYVHQGQPDELWRQMMSRIG